VNSHFSSPPGVLDTQRLVVERHVKATRLGALVAFSMHTALGFAGWAMGAPPLVWLQVFCLSVYAGCYLLSGRNLNMLAAVMTWGDLLVHSTLACWLVGPEGGFQFYSWILLPLMFTDAKRRLRIKIIMSFSLTFIFLAIDVWLHHSTPLLQIRADQLYLLRFFNLACLMIAMNMTALLHTRNIWQAEKRLRAAASTDALTGLMNRRRMSDRMQQELAHAREHQQPLAVLLLDIDNFKTINDHYGHGCGDAVLAQMSGQLSASLRREDVVARWGGEEFMMLLPAADLALARDTAERLRSDIANSTVVAGDHSLSITATIGVALWKRNESLEATLHRADTALYVGKRNGRNRVVLEHEIVEDDDASLAAAS
jgi:diguanylate cyclase (GGDEF)-like protein